MRRSTIHAGMSPVARETPSASETAKSNTRQSMLTNTGTMACTRTRARRMSPIDRPTAIEHARERLEGEQSHELGAGRPERQPNGELARLFRDAGQVQVGHVRAADREHDERQRQQRDHEREDLDRGVVRPESVEADAAARRWRRVGEGCDAAMRAAETVSWRSTSVIVRPAFTRPTTLSQPVSSDGRVGHCGARARGIQACTPCDSSCPGSRRLSPWKRAGATPTTVNELPPSSTGRPIASSRPSRWVRQK